MAGERIIEAIELGIEDYYLMTEYAAAKKATPNLAPPPRNALYMALGGISAEKHLLNTIAKLRASNLQDALLVLPFDKVVDLLTFINIWASRVTPLPLLFPPPSRAFFLTSVGMEYPAHLPLG